MLTHLNYRYRIYPDRVCESVLESNLEACRFLYNYFIEQYDNEYDMNNALPELKELYPELKNYHSKMLQMVSKKVASIHKALKRLKSKGYNIGKPRLKSKDEYNSFTYNQSGFKLLNIDNRWYLWLSKIGYIRIKLHREVNGNIKQVTVKRSNGRWYAVFTVERVYPAFKFIDLRRIVAIDLGIKHFIVDSNNNRVERPRLGKRLIRRLRLIQRKLSRRKKDGSNYSKAKRMYQIIQERIERKRLDLLHKLSRVYADRYDVIVVERLNARRMLEYEPLNTDRQNSTLHRNIQDSAFRKFIDLLKYKAKLLIQVNPKNTTQECYRCGTIVLKELKDRVHESPNCNIRMDRDYNSALNILKRGLDRLQIEQYIPIHLDLDLNLDLQLQLPREPGEVKPGEIKSVNQEASPLKVG